MTANCVIQAKDVIWRRIGDEIVVIKDDGLSSHVLNKTAAFIWDMCDGNYEIDEICARLCERFEVSYEEACTDVREIIRVLTKLGIVKYTKALSRK